MTQHKIYFFNARGQQLLASTTPFHSSNVNLVLQGSSAASFVEQTPVELSELKINVLSEPSPEIFIETIESNLIRSISNDIDLSFVGGEVAFVSSANVELDKLSIQVISSPITYYNISDLYLNYIKVLPIRHKSKLSINLSGSSPADSKAIVSYKSDLDLNLSGRFKFLYSFNFNIDFKYTNPSYDTVLTAYKPIVFYDFSFPHVDEPNLIENLGTTQSLMNGTIHGNPSLSDKGSYQSDLNSRALTFDGEDDFVDIPSHPEFNTNGPYFEKTIEFWIKLDGDDDRRTVFQSGDHVRGIHIFNFRRQLNFCLYNYASFGSNFIRRLRLTNLGKDRWTHVVFTFSSISGDMKVYIDGEFKQVVSGITPLHSFSGPTTIGARRNRSWISNGFVDYDGEPTDFFRGEIDFSIFSRALTEEEIINIYESSKFDYYGYVYENLNLDLDVNFELPYFVLTKHDFKVPLNIYPSLKIFGLTIIEESDLNLSLSGNSKVYMKSQVNSDIQIDTFGDFNWKHRKDLKLYLNPNIDHYVNPSLRNFCPNINFNFSKHVKLKPTSSGANLFIFPKNNVQLTYNGGGTFLWHVRGTVETEARFLWNVGNPPLYFYRLEGKCIKTDCATIGVETNCEEPQTFIQYVAARSVQEVCEALRKTLLSYPSTWPILKIQKFSKPINPQDYEDEVLRGEAENCNVFEDVPFCEIAECLEYCLEPVDSVRMGANVIAVDFFEKHSSNLSLNLETRNRNNYRHSSPNLSLILGVNSNPISSHRETISNTVLNFASDSKITSSHWNYKSNFNAFLSGNSTLTLENWEKISRARLRFRSKNKEKKIPKLDTDLNLSLSGNNNYDIVKFKFPLIFSVSLKGGNTFTKSRHDFSSNIPIVLIPKFKTFRSYNEHSSRFNFNLLGVSRTKVKRKSNLNINISGRSIAKNKLKLNSNVNVNFHPNSKKTSPYWNYTSKSKINLLPQSEFSSSDLGIFEVGFKMNSEISKFEFSQPSVGNFSNLDFLTSQRVRVSCGNCGFMPLILNMKHNIYKENYIGDFFERNNMEISDFDIMKYSRPTNSWTINKKWADKLNHSFREKWQIILDLQCTSSTGVEPLTGFYWKFSLFLRRTIINLQQDFDTRIVTYLKSDRICRDGIFDLDLNLNQTNGNVIGNLNLLSQSLLKDDIGIFKNPEWSNRNIEINISERRLDADDDYFNYEHFINNL